MKAYRKYIELALMFPLMIAAFILASRLVIEIWVQLPNLSSERLIWYFALCFIAGAAWTFLAFTFLNLILDTEPRR